jgi:hypothetical protein
MDERRAPLSPPDDPPPFLGRWRNVYVVLLAELALLVLLFHLLRRWAS